MIACVDTHYIDKCSRTGLVLFEKWSDSFAVHELIDERRQEAAIYVPGRFYQRELPCILSAIKSFTCVVDTLVIDGYVWLNRSGRKGLGALLYEACDKSIRVIGVAKNRFSGSSGIEVFRGASRKPLIVTAAGVDDAEAARLIQTMHGQHRIPTLIKRADYISRHGVNAPD